MRVLRAASAAVALSSTLAGTAGRSAAPPPVRAPFLEVASSFEPVLFRAGKWQTGRTTDASTATVLVDAPRAYATLELRQKGSSRGAYATFLDGVSGKALDTVRFEDLDARYTATTIQLVSRDIQVRISGTPSTDFEASVTRVLLPKFQDGVANGLMPGLTPLSMYLGSADGATKELGLAGQAVALIQLAGPSRTGGCTGFLAAADAVLTAAHCVRDLPGVTLDGRPRAKPCGAIGILFNFVGAGPGGAPVKAVHCLDVRAFSRTPPTRVAASNGSVAGLPDIRADLMDVAVMRIDPAQVRMEDGTERKPLVLGPAADDALGSVVSYPQGGAEAVSRDCRMSRAGAEALVHKCSTSQGSSGAPVLQWTADGWHVVGLHVCCGGTSPEDGSFEQLRQSLSLWNLALPSRALDRALGSSKEPTE